MNKIKLRYIFLYALMIAFIAPIRAGIQTDKYLFDGGYARLNSSTGNFLFFYYNKDHLGNNREVLNHKGGVRQVTSYYPFGAPYADDDAISGTDIQPYKYNGKELDLMHGLNTYDYSARQYYSILGRWDRVDPLCEKYYSTSPYVYCGNNPVMLVDPDGRDSYYTNSGEYIMTDDKETDNIIIRNQYLSYMKSIAGAEWNNPDTPLADADLSAEAYSAIYTNILKRNGFDINKLKNGQVSIVKLKDNTIKDGSQYEADGFYNHEAVIPFHNAPIAQCAVIDSQYEVTAYSHPMGDDNREYLSTVSNVVSVLGVHEFNGHGLSGISGKQHWKILENQRKHSSWNKTTPKLKALYRDFETNKIDHYNRPK